MNEGGGVFACVDCSSGVDESNAGFTCKKCGKKYRVINGVPDFRSNDGYWANVSREKMRELNEFAKSSGDWLGAAKKLMPDYSDHFVPLSRGDAQFLWPTSKDSVILDAGSMWGGITIPAAQYSKSVYALDKTIETLEFLDIRAKQMGFNNIYPVAADLNAKLPFPDDMFDLVILNGVLEWLGVTDEVVLEKHWEGRFDETTEYKKSPTDMQRDALKEIHRVLKPDGALYIGIENRFGIQYFLGMPDDHVNVKFVTFIPRSVASWITKLRKGTEYRNYIYSPGKLKALLAEEGFGKVDIFSVFPHYNTIDSMAPLDIFSRISRPFSSGSNTGLRWRAIARVWRLLPKGLAKYFSPSLSVVAWKDEKSQSALPPRLLGILAQAGLLNADQLDRYRLLIVNSRPGNDNPVHYVVYDTKRGAPIYFCKLGREKATHVNLSREAKMLEYACGILKGSNVRERIPRLAYLSDSRGVPLLATNYVPGESVHAEFLDSLKSLRPERLKTDSKLVHGIMPTINRYATSRWLGKIDPIVRDAIVFLKDFQAASKTGKVLRKADLDERVRHQVDLLSKRGMISAEGIKKAGSFLEEIRSLDDFSVPLSKRRHCIRSGLNKRLAISKKGSSSFLACSKSIM